MNRTAHDQQALALRSALEQAGFQFIAAAQPEHKLPRIGDAVSFHDETGKVTSVFTVDGQLHIMARMETREFGPEEWGPLDVALMRAHGGTIG